jgi:hypothetical protein
MKSTLELEITYNASLMIGRVRVGILESKTGPKSIDRHTSFYAGSYHIGVPLPVGLCFSGLGLAVVLVLVAFATWFRRSASRTKPK